MLYSTAKEFVEFHYEENKIECFNDLHDEYKMEIAGFILAATPDSEKSDIIANLDNLEDIASTLAVCMKNDYLDQNKDFLKKIKLSVADYLEKQVDQIFEDYRQDLKFYD